MISMQFEKDKGWKRKWKCVEVKLGESGVELGESGVECQKRVGLFNLIAASDYYFLLFFTRNWVVECNFSERGISSRKKKRMRADEHLWHQAGRKRMRRRRRELEKAMLDRIMDTLGGHGLCPGSLVRIISRKDSLRIQRTSNSPWNLRIWFEWCFG